MLVDLSSAGCRIEAMGIHLAEGQRVVVRPQGFEGLCATVIWSNMVPPASHSRRRSTNRWLIIFAGSAICPAERR